MKKRIVILLISFIVILASSIAAYAAFTYSLKTNVSINNSSIDQNEKITLTDSQTATSVTIAAQADKDSIHTIKLSNGTEKALSYQLKLTTDADATTHNLTSAILVYVEDQFYGILNQLDGEVLEPSWILPSRQSYDITLKFHLHNSAEAYVGLSFNLTIDSLVQNVDTQKYSFVSNFAEFKEAISSVNYGMEKEIVLLNTISLTEALSIHKNCKINFFGNSYSGNLLIDESAYVTFFTNRGNADYTSSQVTLQSQQAFLYLDDSIQQFNSITVNDFSLDAFFDLISLKIKNGIMTGTTFAELLNNNHFYSSNITLVDEDQVFSENIVQNTFVGEVLVNDQPFEIKVIGKTYESAEFEQIITNELAHIKYYAYDVINGIDLSSNLYLPTSIKQYNASITWESSDTSIMSNDGKLAEGVEGTIYLTAYVRINNKEYQHTFELHVVRQTKDMKLEYLATQIKIRLTKIMDENDTLTYVALPIVSSDTKIYGNVEGAQPQTKSFKDLCAELEIEELWYSEDSRFGYIRVGGTASNPYVGLKVATFEKVAEINIHARFAGDAADEYSTAKINIIIELDASDSALMEKVLSYIQTEASKIDVLQNILDTRAAEGYINEHGDFELPNHYNGFNIVYGALDASYTIDEVTKDTDFSLFRVDATHFQTMESQVSIQVSIYLGTDVGDTETTPGGPLHTGIVHVQMPAAIHHDRNGFSNETVFYSVKYQVLQQSLHNSGDIIVPSEADAYQYLKNIDSNGVERGNYILTYDILNCDTLYFQVGQNQLKCNSQDVSIVLDLISWATNHDGARIAFPQATIELQSYLSDGTNGISPEEEFVILKLCEKYPYFSALWNRLIYLDAGYEMKNTLTDKDITDLESLLGDELYLALIDWVESQTGNQKLSSVIDIGQLDTSLASYIGDFTNDGKTTVSYLEEEALVRYCWSKGYSNFYSVWRSQINYIDASNDDLKVNLSITETDGTAGGIDTSVDNVSLENILFSDEIFYRRLKKWVQFSNNDEKKFLLSQWLEEDFIEYYGLSIYSNTNQGYYKGLFSAYDRTSDDEKKVLQQFSLANGYPDISTSNNNPLENTEWQTLTNSITAGKGYFKTGVDYTMMKQDVITIINWAEDTHSQTLVSNLTLNHPFTDSNILMKMNDQLASFSYAEYEILRSYLIMNYSTLIDETKSFNGETHTALYWIDKALSLYFNMNYSQNILDKNTLYQSLNIDTLEFRNLLLYFQNKKDIQTEYTRDTLPSISIAEKEMIIDYINNSSTIKLSTKEKVIEKLNQLLIYPLDSNNQLLLPTFSADAQQKLNNYLERITPKKTSDYTELFYFENDIILDSDSFAGLGQFKNLTAIFMKGTSEKTFFASNTKANNVLTYITNELPLLQTIVYNDTGLSDISCLEEIQSKLQRLDISGNEAIENLSSLIIIDLSQMSYLNVANVFTDEEFIFQFVLFKKIYYSSQVEKASKRFIYSFENRDYYFSDSDLNSLKFKAMQAAYLLKEINIIWADKMTLTNKVGLLENNELVYYQVFWQIRQGSLTVEDKGEYSFLKRISKEEGSAIISATVTVTDMIDGVEVTETYTRYFIVSIQTAV